MSGLRCCFSSITIEARGRCTFTPTHYALHTQVVFIDYNTPATPSRPRPASDVADACVSVIAKTKSGKIASVSLADPKTHTQRSE